MSTDIFPTVAGAGYPIKSVPNFATIKNEHVSGARTRIAQRAYPIWDFTLTFAGLASNGAWGAVGADTLQAVMGFLCDRQGSFDSFLLLHDIFNTVTNQVIGTGDGATTEFTLTWMPGSSLAIPVGYVFYADITSVKVNGVPVSSANYSVSEPNTLVLASAPAAGQQVTWSGQFYFQVTFSEDNLEFDEIMDNLFECQELKLQSLPPESIAASAMGSPYDIMCEYTAQSSGLIPTSIYLLNEKLPRAVTFPSGAGASTAYAQSASTGTAVFDIYQNPGGAGSPTLVGTVTFSAGVKTGVVNFSASTVFAAGDVITIVSPSSQDASLANVGITLSGSV